jgi:FkbM family methyltransferase
MQYQSAETSIGTFYLDGRDKFVARSLLEQGDYSPGERLLYSKFVNENSNVLWLGAHIGALMIPISKMVKHVTTFEANPHTFQILQKNIEANDCRNVKAYNLAANDEDCDLQFVCNTVNSGGSKRLPLEMIPAYLDNETSFEVVHAVCLDTFLVTHDYDFIFMDIEGSETHAMLGMTSIIQNAKTLVAEFIPHHLTNVSGVNISEFLNPLRDFQTMISPALKKVAFGAEIQPLLETMFNSNVADAGLIFHRDRINVNIKPSN